MDDVGDQLTLKIVKGFIDDAHLQRLSCAQPVFHQGQRGDQAAQVQGLCGDFRAVTFAADLLKQVGKLIRVFLGERRELGQEQLFQIIPIQYVYL